MSSFDFWGPIHAPVLAGETISIEPAFTTGAVWKWTCLNCGTQWYLNPPFKCPICRSYKIRWLQKVHHTQTAPYSDDLLRSRP